MTTLTPQLSPDGPSVLFVALGDLWHMEIGAKPEQLTDDPDGGSIAYASDKAGTEDLYVRDLATARNVARRVSTVLRSPGLLAQRETARLPRPQRCDLHPRPGEPLRQGTGSADLRSRPADLVRRRGHDRPGRGRAVFGAFQRRHQPDSHGGRELLAPVDGTADSSDDSTSWSDHSASEVNERADESVTDRYWWHASEVVAEPYDHACDAYDELAHRAAHGSHAEHAHP